MADITLTLTDNEQQVLTTLLDAAVRQLGLQGAAAGEHFRQKLAEAQRMAALPLPPPRLVEDAKHHDDTA